MPDSLAQKFRPFLDSIGFAARAHQGQLRKDNQTPYVSHAFRVCMILRHVFEIPDPRILITAVLHDTIEDTTTDFDDLEIKFDQEIATWVAMLSKDKRQMFEEREEAYCQVLAGAPWQVQVCKLADVFDNLLDLSYLPQEGRLDALERKRPYLQAIESSQKPEVAKALALTSQLFEELARELSH